jgi:hypothetical protein
VQKLHDLEYEDHVISEVTRGEDGWGFTMEDGLGFFCPDRGIEPHVGDTARLYGKGFGFVVRGLDINGQEIFYRTPAQREKENKRQAEQYRQDQRDRFEQNKAELDAQYDALPSVFKARVDRFRRNNPDFRWKHESYELFTCTEAVKIANHFGSPDAINEFYHARGERQREMFPSLSDGHSGNTFGAACRFAQIYLSEPELIERMHGALCPLVGCKEYGCFAAYQDQRRHL